ncbi:MAG: NAD(P)/FAD-dependent oxidoreductase [Desulfovibrio sp.]|jgi:thioredoxin reductase (NADPH)|nr:NAD(P)/FAD-dependent oxidoreductase [Desulfovibrio sp.]
MKTAKHFDIVIVGGGMAGMTAAIYAARADRSCVLLETAITGGLANSTYLVENFPSYTGVHGMELMQKVREQVDHLGVTVEEICEVVRCALTAKRKTVETEDTVYDAGAVIIATGRKPVPLDVPTECAQVHYCSVCDGAPYKGKDIVVVGGGNSAFDEGLYLHRLGVRRITLVEKEDRFFAAQKAQDALLGNANVTCRLNTFVEDLVVGDDKLKAAVLKNPLTGTTEAIDAEGVFVFLGQEPNSSLFRGMLNLDHAGYVLADEHMQTNIAGVFSAGDINAKRFHQLTTAAADGTTAALMADRYLWEQK